MRLALNAKIEILLIQKIVRMAPMRRIKPVINQDAARLAPNETLLLETSTSTGRGSNAEHARSPECRSRFSTMRSGLIIEQSCLLPLNRQAFGIYRWSIRSRRTAGD